MDARDKPHKDKKKSGQNKARHFGSSNDEKGLCSSRALSSEFSPKECQYGEKCRFEHDLRRYLKECKREDLQTFHGSCPNFSSKGWCLYGWKCRFAGSHSTERKDSEGKQELVLLGHPPVIPIDEDGGDFVNIPGFEKRNDLMRKKFPLPKSELFSKWIDTIKKANEDTERSNLEDNRAIYREAPLLPSEKRKVYFGPETPILAPLTTQGNLPFRRLCVELGAELTYSEMAMGLPLIQGKKSEWALLRAHQVEISPPAYQGKGQVVQSYDNSKDFKFGAQIAGNQPWLAMKTTEAITSLCPHLRVVDLNCGCPIDLVCDQGAGSALLDNHSKLEKILRGMNTVSGEVPITVKIRTGTKDSKPTATKLIDRLVYGTADTQATNDIKSGIAAITLHGRSKQQRYTKNADWEYIADCAALINRHKANGDLLADTIREADPRSQANNGRVFFNGNGDCYSHISYHEHLESAKVDAVMIGRGALIKPWLFEEIASGQYLDKSSKERLEYIEKFCRHGMEVWGSDEMGIGMTRRFLLEWLNFAHRYVPIGLLEYLPPNLQERAQPWKGRDELETLMGSDDYKDWIKIRYKLSFFLSSNIYCACDDEGG